MKLLTLIWLPPLPRMISILSTDNFSPRLLLPWNCVGRKVTEMVMNMCNVRYLIDNDVCCTNKFSIDLDSMYCHCNQ